MVEKKCPVCFGPVDGDRIRCPSCGWDFPAACGDTVEAARWLLSRIAEARAIWHSRKAGSSAVEEQEPGRFFLKVTDRQLPPLTDSPNVGLRVLPKLKLIKSGPIIEENSIGMEFIRIEGGTFHMGADDDDFQAQEYEKPSHEVVLSRPFSLAKHPATQRQWVEVMGYNPSFFKGETRPVENISWHEACEFIKRLNDREKSDRHRLPTEAEWEYAAKDGELDAFCDDPQSLNRFAWHADNSKGGTHQVGMLSPNSLGLMDMLGNVWEWVYDWFGDYAADQSIDPLGPKEGSDKIIRGGAWGSAPWLCRVAARSVKAPNVRSPLIGLRLVLDEALSSRKEFSTFFSND
ncbi:MAG: formylglycine-generating enzyme family protein [Deltaproteobacteria bacterium]|jgi:formylglycine-generating enzyme required for sulfatase activity|nr:formylglycine-generating enzyme family protein [Deltaproteobacteria bacterium]